jgi:glycosyltransferase involved in cell wall biosynthesis
VFDMAHNDGNVRRRIHFVIPAYNEGRSIQSVVSAIRRHFDDAQVVVVDDGSVDGTGVVAEAAGATVLTLPFNCGYGVALQTGLLYAQRHAAAIVVTLDADGQHEVGDVSKLIAPIDAGVADLALGSRYLPGSNCYRVPPSRRAVSWLLSKLVSLLVGYRISDTTTGFQALNSRTLNAYLALRDFPDATPDADLLLYAHMHGCRVLEVPVTMHEDVTGDSMHGLIKSIFYVPKMLVSLLSIALAYSHVHSKH